MNPVPPLADCDRCPAQGNRMVLPDAIGPRRRLAIVTDAANWAEREAGVYGEGNANRRLQQLLAREHVARFEIHWTAAVLCECEWSQLAEARKCCAARLQDELKRVEEASMGEANESATEKQPEAGNGLVVMAAGGMALQTCAGLKKRPDLTKWRGSLQKG